MSGGGDDAVGHGRPPRSGRFSASNPGNRRGRPRGSKNLKTIVRQIAHERQLVQEDGVSVSRSNRELLLLTLQHRALTGDIRAIELLNAWCARLGRGDEPPRTIYCLPERDTSETHERSMKAEAAIREYDARQARNKAEVG